MHYPTYEENRRLADALREVLRNLGCYEVIMLKEIVGAIKESDVIHWHEYGSALKTQALRGLKEQFGGVK